MNNKSYRLCDIIDESSCELIDRELEDFSQNAELDEISQQRIISSVMRKAGFEMRTNINVTSTKKRSKRFIGFMAAAIIAVTGAVGAGAAYSYQKITASERYLGEGASEVIESMGANSDMTIKGRHFDINIETLLSDGEYLTVIANAVPNDDKGFKMIADGNEPSLHSQISERSITEYEDGGFIYDFDEDFNNSYENGKEIMRWSYFLDETQEKITVPMSVIILGAEGISDPVAEFELTFEKNVNTVKLENKAGETLTLSEYSVNAKDVTIETADDPLPMREVKVELKDGTEKVINVFGIYPDDTTEDNHYDKMGITFLTLIDTEDVSAITIGATRFEKR